MYTKPVSEIIIKHNINWDDIASSIEACIAHISILMNSQMLKSNKY